MDANPFRYGSATLVISFPDRDENRTKLRQKRYQKFWSQLVFPAQKWYQSTALSLL
jgi:hypothetical protein